MSPARAVDSVADLRPSTLHLPPGAWLTVLDCLCAHFPAIKRTQWLDRMQRGRVLDERGRALDASVPYRAGLCIRYFRELTAESPIPFAETILHVDADLVVADKPHFLPVMPAGEYLEQTLLRRLVRRLDNPHLVPLHRIDRATAGLVMFSANPASRARYQALFRERRIEKRYEALAPPLSQLEFPLERHTRLVPAEPFFRMREIAGESNSHTRIEVLERAGTVWRYLLTPITGKKHQLRVHLSALGAPILNDAFYPELIENAGHDFTRPLQLLAKQLSFVDPLSGERRTFESARRLRADVSPAATLMSDPPASANAGDKRFARHRHCS